MNIIKILEQIELYGASIITNDGVEITCKCRFNHKFICTNDNDWCKICETSNFNESLISEINTELEELDNNLKVLSINKYGISTLKCKKKHFVNCDLDNIPNACNKCYLLNKPIKYEDEDDDITKDDNISDANNLLNYYNIPDECDTSDEGDMPDESDEYELRCIGSDDNNTDCDSVNSNGDNCCSDWLDKFNNDPGQTFNKETNYYDTFNLEIYEYTPMKYEEPVIHRPNNILYVSVENFQ
jgi:hypothetical protein